MESGLTGRVKTMNDCIFCKIADKTMPAKLISEKEHTLAFLDINPVSPGHTLVIPKAHAVNASDADDQMLTEMILHTREVGVFLKDALGASGYNIVNANGRSAQQSVFHIHFHVVPRFDNDGLRLWFHGAGHHGTGIDNIYNQLMDYLKNREVQP